MNLDASIRTRGLAGPVMNMRAGFGFSNPPSRSPVSLGGKPWICTPAFECENEGRARYVREQYQGLYGVAAPIDLIQRVLASDFYSKESLHGMVVSNPPAGGSIAPIEAGAAPGSSGPPADRSTVDTPNPFPNGTGLAPGSSNVTPGGVQFRNDTTPPAATGPLGLPAMLFGYPTTTVLGAGAALLVAIAVALAYAPKRGRGRR